MNKAEAAVSELHSMDMLASMNSPLHRVSPLIKLLVTVVYIICVTSFHKYNFSGLIVMVLFPVVGYQMSGIPISTCFRKLKIVMPLVCAVGILNPWFDQSILLRIGGVSVSGGVVSMLTLMMKGVFTLMMSFLLMATTRIEALCGALRTIHCPKVLVSLFLLTYRYVSVFLREVATMTNAYHLRAPKQKGIQVSAWGSFLGQLLLRSMDRANALYESMVLRGFHGEFYYTVQDETGKGSILFGIAAIVLMAAARWFNLSVLLGGLVL